ncbi:MAG TPA: hypothetical protein V6D17_05200 [Candidatus Obscuribacterales bacterium]
MPLSSGKFQSPPGGGTSKAAGQSSLGTTTLRLNLSTNELFDRTRRIYEGIGLPPRAQPMLPQPAIFAAPPPDSTSGARTGNQTTLEADHATAAQEANSAPDGSTASPAHSIRQSATTPAPDAACGTSIAAPGSAAISAPSLGPSSSSATNQASAARASTPVPAAVSAQGIAANENLSSAHDNSAKATPPGSCEITKTLPAFPRPGAAIASHTASTTCEQKNDTRCDTPYAAAPSEYQSLVDFSKSPEYAVFELPNCRTVKQEHAGFSLIEQFACDFKTRRVQSDAISGSKETVRDRYGRLIYEKTVDADGNWSAREFRYQDEDGKRSPFIAFERKISSDGTLREITYGKHGIVSEQKEWKAHGL